MKRYEAYKPSNLPWVAEIPSGWKISKNSQLFRESSELSEKGEEPLLSLSQYTGISYKSNAAKIGMREADSKIGYRVIHEDDIVMNIMLAWNGSTAVSPFDGIISPAYAVYRQRTALNPKYFHYLFRIPAICSYFESNSTGLIKSRLRLYSDSFMRLFSIFPPREEQDQIVRYLDWQMSKINRLIAAKRKEIALLREQIQQTITDVVYHGVDQAVNYQPVKMLYVDKIPEHWECKRGKFLFAEHDIRSTDGKEELLSVSHITGVTPRSQKNITMFKAESLVNYKICRKNDIAANTMWMWQGAIAVSSYHGVISPSYNTYHQIDNAYDSAYLDYMLRSKPLVDEYYVRSTGIRKSRLRLYPEQLLDMFFPVPPVEEQKRIAAVIAEKTQAANDFIAAIEKQIEKINEFRVRMISDVVTGQIDVRGIEVPEFEMVRDTVEEQEEDEEEIMQET